MATEVDPQGPHSPLCACALLCFLTGRALPWGSEGVERAFFLTLCHWAPLSDLLWLLGQADVTLCQSLAWASRGLLQFCHHYEKDMARLAHWPWDGEEGFRAQLSLYSVTDKSKPELGHRQTPDNQNCWRESGQINWGPRTGEKRLIVVCCLSCSKANWYAQ